MAKVKRNERSTKEFDTIVRYQVEYAHFLQEKAHELLDSLENKTLSQPEVHDVKRCFQILRSKGQEIIIFLKMLSQLKNEIAGSLLELERAIKSNINVASAKLKVKWLQRKLKIFSHLSKKTCHMKYHKEEDGESARIHLQHLSTPFFDKLIDEESKQKLQWNSDDNDVIIEENVLDEIAEMSYEKIFSLTSLDDKILNSIYKDSSAKDTSPERWKENWDSVMCNGSEANLKSSHTELQTSTIKSDMVENYWNSDHHRFEIMNFMQKIDPRSWHSLALSCPDSFLKGDEKFPTDEIPWRYEGSSPEASSFGQRSMEKLHESLKTLFHEIINASVNSIKANEQTEYVHSSRPARNRRNKQKIGKSTDVKKDDFLPYMENHGFDDYERETTKLFSRPVSVVLPVVKQDPDKQFPRKPTVWCDLSKVNIPKHSSNLRGMKKGLKEVPTINTRRQNLSRAGKNRGHLSLKQAIGKVAVFAKFTPPKEGLLQRNGRRWERIIELLGDSGIKSQNREIVIDALKALSQLGVSQKEVIHGIRSKVHKETDHHILYEASKCVLSLGWWDAFAVMVMEKALYHGERILKMDALDAIINAKNAQFINKKRSDIASLIQLIMQFVNSKDQDLALNASLSLGHLCIVDSKARDHLYTRLHDVSFSVRAKALETLVRQMNCKDDVVIDSILFQLSNARNWKQRIAAATLLQYIGVKDAAKDPDKVFDTLEKLLWNHPCEEIRIKAAEVINEFGMRPKSIYLASKRLDDLDEGVRSNAVQMLSSMRMKGEKELKLFLDIMELDSSVNVRIQVIKTFDALKWDDPRVIRCLQERQKGEGILAREAANTLNSLMSIDKTSATL